MLGPDNDIFESVLHENKDFSHVQITTVNTRPLDGTAFVAPFVKCPKDVAIEALEFANISNRDTLLDLGCGDGSLLWAALEQEARKQPQKVIGVELDEHLFRACQNHKYKDKDVTLINSDMFQVNVLELNCSVMVLYLLPGGLNKLRAVFTEFLQHNPQNRIVTIQYAVPEWEPTAEHVYKNYRFFLYRAETQQ